MLDTIYDRLLKRELGNRTRYSGVRGIYGDKNWVDGLDIVNELDGHTGCVNTLSWSRSGKLLASGSDDTNVNIHSYLPESSATQFSLTTTISTGHQANIFSVKFMPHSDDRTVVTAAGDSEVRIFDIEYAGRAQIPSTGSTLPSPGRSRLSNVYNGVRFLSNRDTNAKVFQSHSDRVKRIVTESSPYFFLTCSEDGEVRQWDLRQPSSAYPAPRGYPRWSSSTGASDNVPPPLISYRRYHLDLNTISCSPSQPHYIALGGAHLHCFLHDRRMLGRDKLLERGAPASSPSNWSDHDDEMMSQATRCVRKFAPDGQKTMKPNDNGHITACKISDANPNEMVVSWSGDYIYSFDLARSPDAREQADGPDPAISKSTRSSKVKESKSRKRKRAKAGSFVSQEGADRGCSRPRTESSTSGGAQPQMALMVQYENGQSEQIPIEPSESRGLTQDAQESYTEGEKTSFRIAKMVLKVRKSMFTLGTPRRPSETDVTGHGTSFTTVLGSAASILPDMNDIITSWRYPVNPSSVDVTVQNTLRGGRAAARRFVQASGTLARVLGGKLRTAGNGESIAGQSFGAISTVLNEQSLTPSHEQFVYDFLKAILLWLDSGIGALLEGFTWKGEASRQHSRFPIPEDSTAEAIDEILIPYLLRLAGPDPITNVDASRFEVDDRRMAFESETAAVIAFAQALKIPFADLSSAVVPAATASDEPTTAAHVAAQDRQTALKFWAFKVGRGLLLSVGKAIDFAVVDRAFGGRGIPDNFAKEEEAAFKEQHEEINVEEEEDTIVSATLVRRLSARETEEGRTGESHGPRVSERQNQATVESDDEGSESQARQANTASIASEDKSESEAEETDDDDEDADADGTEEHDEGSSEDEGQSRIIYRTGFSRHVTLREKVEEGVPCFSHTRRYRGHCNVKTVKDINFYGLQDEYVVSGSDCGHLFIWDKKTSELVNILEGDGEVVNVIQGHPYEPMIAVSGIDHTVKIFSPDARARWNARNGIGVSAADASSFSSLELGRRRRQARSRPSRRSSESAAAATRPESTDTDDETQVAPNGLSSKRKLQDLYQIISSNDEAMRDGSRGGAFISGSVLSELMAHIQERMNAEDGDDDGDGDGESALVAQLFAGGDCRPM